MQDMDQQIMRFYEAFSFLISFASLVMFAVAVMAGIMAGRSSTEKTLICIGAALQGVSVVVSLGFTVLQRVSPDPPLNQIFFLVYGVSHLVSFAGTAMGLWGAITLVRRANHLELLLQEESDER